jgi:hypothetical protein
VSDITPLPGGLLGRFDAASAVPGRKARPARPDAFDPPPAVGGGLSVIGGQNIVELAVGHIEVSADVQPRAGGVNADMAAEYAEAMRAGAKFPPPVVYSDGERYWLSEGFHRVEGRRLAGFTTVACEIRQGGKDDARWNALASNRTHGLRRTNEDKRRAVETALAMRPELSDNLIAEHCGVSQPFVGKVRQESGASNNGYKMRDGQVREESSASGEFPQMRTVTRGGKTYRQNTSKIGKGRKKRSAAKPAATKSEPPSIPQEPSPATEPEVGPKSAAAPPPRDAAGMPVPEQARTAFEAAALIADWGRRLDALIRDGAALASGPGGRLIDIEAARLHLRNGKVTVVQNRATHVCPLCSGLPRDTPCRCCQGEGWTAEHVWKRLTAEKAKGR